MELLARHGHRDLSAHHRAVHWHDGDQLGALAPQVLAALGPLVITRAESILAPLGLQSCADRACVYWRSATVD